MSYPFTVFDANSGDWLRGGITPLFIGIARQSLASNEIVVEGQFSHRARLVEGWPIEDAEPLPAVTLRDVKDHAARLLKASDWQASRHRDELDLGETPSLTEGEFAALLARRAAIRAASNRIEQMTPIPADFRDAAYWTTEEAP